MLKPGDTAPDRRLRDSSGSEVALSDLWRERPLVLVFLRHFG
jgi:peroxiredoxin